MSNTDRGQATVEFALVLPFLFLFSLSVIQVGSVANDQLALGHAARTAARAISLGDVTEQNAGEIVRNIVATEITLADVTVNVDLNKSLARVTLRYTRPVKIPIIGSLMPAITLKATASMPRELSTTS